MKVAESETQKSGAQETLAPESPKGSPSLDIETKLPDIVGRPIDLIVYPESGEFVVVPHQGKTNGIRVRKSRGQGADRERSKQVAMRRARSKIRRYAVQFALRFMWTLTYADPQTDPKVVLRDIERLIAKVVADRGYERFPYVRVLEWHKTDHGLHVHIGVPFRISHARLWELWAKGFVWCSDKKPKGAATAVGARVAAGYLSKYVGKAFEVAEFGSHRYECAQGFDVTKYVIPVQTLEDGYAYGTAFFTGKMMYFWTSLNDPEWDGPPVVFASFDGPAQGAIWEAMKRRLDAHLNGA